jgi:hypothetical protein
MFSLRRNTTNNGTLSEGGVDGQQQKKRAPLITPGIAAPDLLARLPRLTRDEIDALDFSVIQVDDEGDDPALQPEGSGADRLRP